MVDILCKPPSTLRFGSLPGLLASLPKSPLSGNSKVTVDLKSLRWIEALPLAVLAALVRAHQANGGTGFIQVPPRYEFLQRMNLFKVIGSKLPEKFRREPEEGRFVPLREVRPGQEVQEAAMEIVNTLKVDDEDSAMVLRHCVGELVDNVGVHAMAKTPAIICAQHFPNAKRTQVAIVDAGIGFRKSFQASAVYQSLGLSDRDALKLGVAPYVTSKPIVSGDPYASGYGRLGVGLFIVSEILLRVGGKLLLASGEATLRRTPAGQRWRVVSPWQGAVVGFEVPDSPLMSYRDATAEARRLAKERRNV